MVLINRQLNLPNFNANTQQNSKYSGIKFGSQELSTDTVEKKYHENEKENPNTVPLEKYLSLKVKYLDLKIKYLDLKDRYLSQRKTAATIIASYDNQLNQLNSQKEKKLNTSA